MDFDNFDFELWDKLKNFFGQSKPAPFTGGYQSNSRRSGKSHDGYTKNTGQKASKVRRKMAQASRRRNR